MAAHFGNLLHSGRSLSTSFGRALARRNVAHRGITVAPQATRALRFGECVFTRGSFSVECDLCAAQNVP